jgi:signal transduction histidine kinase
VFGFGVAYTAATWLQVRRGRAVRAGAVATALGDAVLVAAICSCTGGLASDFYAYFYLTQIAASIRFGAGAAFAMLAVNAALSATLLAVAAATAGDLGLRLFYLFFATLLGSVLSAHARENLAAAAPRATAQNLPAWRLIGAEEEERKRIAGELHDRMGARFFELTTGSTAVAARSATTRGEGLFSRGSAPTRACGDEIRELDERPAPVGAGRLRRSSEALREWARRAAGAEGGGSRSGSRSTPRPGVSPEANVALFRMAQEAVLNARKHAHSQTLAIDLSRESDGEELRLEIRDDGRGFDPRAPVRGLFGLFTMRERAEACGGRLEIDSAPGRGTRLCAVVPAGAAR